MRRLRRKTPHEPMRAVPAPVERGAGALPRAAAPSRSPIQVLAHALNGGTPRPRLFDIEPAPTESLRPPVAPAPFRDRVAAREGRAELLVFRIGTEWFATELRAVEEAVEGGAVQVIPDAPPAMLGIFALRDRTLPMYALARVLGLDGDQAVAMTLVVRPGEVRIALAVDGVDDVYETTFDAVRPAPGDGDADGLVLGVVWRAGELVTLLDADAIVAACLAAAPMPVPDAP